jgi:hypothetical protein
VSHQQGSPSKFHDDPDILGIEGEDAKRLQQLAARRHQRPAEAIADLLRSA